MARGVRGTGAQRGEAGKRRELLATGLQRRRWGQYRGVLAARELVRNGMGNPPLVGKKKRPDKSGRGRGFCSSDTYLNGWPKGIPGLDQRFSWFVIGAEG